MLIRFVMAALMATCLGLVGVVAFGGLIDEPTSAVADGIETSAQVVERTSVELEPVAVDPLSITKISAVACDESQIGSGFLTAEGLFTAAHVVGDAEVAFVTPHRQQSIMGTIVGRTADGEDVSLLDVSLDQPSLPTTNVLPERGSTTTLAGHPLGGPLTIRVGQMLGTGAGALFGLEAERVVMVDVSVEEGFSGGPVLNSAGEVFAVIVAVEVGTNTTLAIPLADLELDGFARHECGT